MTEPAACSPSHRDAQPKPSPEPTRADAGNTDPQDATQTAASRNNYLQLLQALQGRGPVVLHLHDTEGPRTASSLVAMLPDSSAFLVRQLQTPLGVVPAAILRGSDIIRIAVDITQVSLEQDAASNDIGS